MPDFNFLFPIDEKKDDHYDPYTDPKYFGQKFSTDFKFDKEKLRWDLMPIEVIEEVVKVYTFGAKKYGEYTWQKLENPIERYYAAILRHLIEWRKGNKIDNESNCKHLAHLIWNAISIIYLEDKNEYYIRNYSRTSAINKIKK